MRGIRYSRNRVALGSLLSILFAVGGCAGEGADEGPSQNPQDVLRPLEETCDAALTGSSLADLKSLIEAAEGPIEDNAFGEKREGASNLAGYAVRLRSSDRTYVGDFCHIYSPDHMGAPFATIGFGWEKASAFQNSESEVDAVYNAGVFAFADADIPATIGFSCPVGGVSDDKILTAMLFAQSPGLGEYDLRMSIINSISRSIAEELGCLDEAHLPQGMPKRITE